MILCWLGLGLVAELVPDDLANSRERGVQPGPV